MPIVELSGRQQLQLRDALRALYVTEADFDELLLAIDKSLADVSRSEDRFPRRILSAIQEAQARGWLMDLIAEAHRQVPADPMLQQIDGELKILAPAPNMDPFKVCLLSGGHVLVNRSRLREALEELWRPIGKRILVVKDDASLAANAAAERVKTGKSHSFQMIAYLKQVIGGFELVRVDLEAENRAVGSGKLVQPYDLAKSIASQMGCKHLLSAPPSDGQWARWTLDFCNDFETPAKAAARTWIVVDSFHLVLLPAETTDFLKELAGRVNTTLPNLRMVLLGYSDSFHPSIIPTVEEETLNLPGESELIDFFARAFKEKHMPATEDEVVERVEAVLQGLDRRQPDFVIKVSSLAMAELRRP